LEWFRGYHERVTLARQLRAARNDDIDLDDIQYNDTHLLTDTVIGASTHQFSEADYLRVMGDATRVNVARLQKLRRNKELKANRRAAGSLALRALLPEGGVIPSTDEPSSTRAGRQRLMAKPQVVAGVATLKPKGHHNEKVTVERAPRGRTSSHRGHHAATTMAPNPAAIAVVSGGGDQHQHRDTHDRHERHHRGDHSHPRGGVGTDTERAATTTSSVRPNSQSFQSNNSRRQQQAVVATLVDNPSSSMPAPPLPATVVASIATVPMEEKPDNGSDTEPDTPVDASITVDIDGRRYWIHRTQQANVANATTLPNPSSSDDGYDVPPVPITVPTTNAPRRGGKAAASRTVEQAAPMATAVAPPPAGDDHDGGGDDAGATAASGAGGDMSDDDHDEASLPYGLQGLQTIPSRAWREAWSLIVKRKIPREAKVMNQRIASRDYQTKRLSNSVRKEMDKRAAKKERALRDEPLRQKRLAREQAMHWRRQEKEMAETRRRLQREAEGTT
jgi:hypothetical protein